MGLLLLQLLMALYTLNPIFYGGGKQIRLIRVNKYIFVCKACGTKMTFETHVSMGSSIGCVCGGSAKWIGSTIDSSMYENQVDFE
jgi:hypothetical protein